MLHALGQLLQQIITLISLSAGVLAFSPLLFLLMIGAVLPAFLGESHFAFLAYALAYSVTPMRRELDYLRDLGTKKESAKELKLFGLGEYWRGKFSSISNEVIGRSQRLAGRRLRMGALLAIIGSLGYYGSYAFLVLRTLRGALTLGELNFLAGGVAGTSRQMQMAVSSSIIIAEPALCLADLLH